MTFLPIISRELRVASRKAVTYRNRVVIAGVVAALAIGVLCFGSFSTAGSHVGSILIEAMSWIAFALCLVAGLIKTADSLSEEKRQGTLGFLFLTEVRAYDIVLGKFVAQSIGSIHGLLSLMPIFAVSFILGGLSYAEFWRMSFALVAVQIFSLCCGIAVSSCSRVRYRALLGTTLLVVAFIGLPYLTKNPSLRVLSPLTAFRAAFDTKFVAAPNQYFDSLQFTLAFSGALLVWASLVAPRSWHDVAKRQAFPRLRAWFNRWQFGDAVQRATVRTKMLERNPILWLAGRNLASRRFMWAIAAIGIAGGGFLAINSHAKFLPAFFGYIEPVRFMVALGAFSQMWFVIIWTINFILKVRLALHACHCLADARQNQALEMLLTTPLTVNQIIGGQLHAMAKTFLLPVLAIFMVELLGTQIASAGMVNTVHERREALMLQGALMLYTMMFVLDAMAIIWAGMWFGLCSRKENEAAIKTVLFVAIAPIGCLFFWPLGSLVFISAPIFLICYARHKLLNHFRQAASQHLGTHGQTWTIPFVPFLGKAA